MSVSKKPPVKPVVDAKPVVAAKPVVEAKPVVAPKPAVEAKPVVAAAPAPTVVPAPAKVAAPAAVIEAPVAKAAAPAAQAPKTVAKPAAPAMVADLMKPVNAIQETLRAQTEKALSEARGRYAEVKGLAETATSRLEDSMKAAQSGSREFGFKLFEIAKAQTQDNLDLAKTLAGAKTLPEFVKLQQDFFLAQFRVSQDRAKDVSDLANRIANDVTAPLRASFAAFARR